MDIRKKNWEIADMIAYAQKQYDIPEKELKSKNSAIKPAFRHGLEQQIRRVLRSEHMVNPDKDGRYRYKVSEADAKYLVDTLLKDYICERLDEDAERTYYANKDAELNDRLHELNTIQSQEDYENQAPWNDVSNEELDLAVDRFMLRAIFEVFYSDFDENQFREDYANRYFLGTNGSIEDGYSKLNDKLSDPVKNYCKRRKK